MKKCWSLLVLLVGALLSACAGVNAPRAEQQTRSIAATQGAELFNQVVNPAEKAPTTKREIGTLTVEELRVLSEKGERLEWADILGVNMGLDCSSSPEQIAMVYGIAEKDYRLVVNGEKRNGDVKLSRVMLESIYGSSDSGIDIRYQDVDAFLGLADQNAG